MSKKHCIKIAYLFNFEYEREKRRSDKNIREFA